MANHEARFGCALATWTIMIYRFGDFVANDETRQLLREGVETPLTPKAFELLHLLLANRSRAVSKAELQKWMWPSTFVEETNLASLVAEVRRALGESAANPVFVKTLYGFGYRFVGEVHGDAVGSPVEPSPVKRWVIFEQRLIPLMEGVNVIGRAPDAAIQIDAPALSRYHARIRVTREETLVEDLGSKNGTLLNGNRIAVPTPLRDGDEVRLGAIVLIFRISSDLDPTESLPPAPL